MLDPDEIDLVALVQYVSTPGTWDLSLSEIIMTLQLMIQHKW